MILLLTAAALAQSPAYYSPDSIAQNSKVFRSFSEQIAPQFAQLQNKIGRAGGGLAQLEKSVLLLGDRAPDTLKAHLETSRRTVNHAYLVFQQHISLLETDSQAIFEAAMGRAIVQHGEGRALVECSNPRGMMSFGPGRGQKNCAGEDLSAVIAASVDKDEKLKASVASILSVEWPVLNFEAEPLDAVAFTGVDSHVSVELLSNEFLDSEMIELYAVLDRDLAPFQLAMESEDEAEKAAALEGAKAIRQAFESAFAAEGERLWAAMEQPLRKKKMSIALCANPLSLGGCPGENRTDEVIEMLRDNRKFKKAFR